LKVPEIDVIIDDGGHESHQQIPTLEELVPCLRPGGVYICEDVHGSANNFMQYVYGLASQMNSMDGFRDAPDDAERRLVVSANKMQNSIRSIALYPFVVAIEMNVRRTSELFAPKRGTQWQPFLS